MSLVFALFLIGAPFIYLIADTFMSPPTTSYRPEVLAPASGARPAGIVAQKTPNPQGVTPI
jgi:hypothetical protein